MAVTDGSPVDAATTNAAFMSRTADTSTIGIVALNHPSSGGTISNLQQTLNNALVRESFSTQDIAASGNITISGARVQYRPVAGDGGAVTTDTQPFGSTALVMVQGKMIELVGTSDTNTVTIPYSDTQYGALVNGDCTLSKGNILVLIYDSTLERWLEYSRNF